MHRGSDGGRSLSLLERSKSLAAHATFATFVPLLVGRVLTGVGDGPALFNVKAVADLVCPSVDEEGVAQVIEAFLDSRG